MKVPTGPRSWRNSVTGRRSFVSGCPGMPVNYDEGGGLWRSIVTAWADFGDRREVLSAGHNADIESESLRMRWLAAGAFRDVRLRPDRIVRVDKSTLEWETIVTASAPSSVDRVGSTLFLRNIYPNVDRRIQFDNDAVHDGIVFHDAARLALAAMGGWAGKWIGTVSDVDLSAIPSATIRKFTGNALTPDVNGLLLDEPTEVVTGGSRVFALPPKNFMEGPTGETWGFPNVADFIPIRTVLIVIGGRLKLIEVFDPIATATIPPGDIAHNFTFGYSGSGALNGTIQNKVVAGHGTAADGDGVGVSIWAYVVGASGETAITCALYEDSGNNTDDQAYIADGQTDESFPTGGNNFYEFPFTSAPTIEDATDYSICCWGDSAKNTRFDFSGDYFKSQTVGYDGDYPGTVGDPWSGYSKQASVIQRIYCEYEEAPAAGPPLGTLATLGVGI